MPTETAHKPVASRSRTGRGCAWAALAAAIALVGASPAQASSQTRTVDPVRITKTEVSFKLRGMEASSVVGARVNFFASKRRSKTLQRAVGVARVRGAIRSQRTLRLRKPRYARRGNLQLTLVGDGPQSPQGCAFDGPGLTAVGCDVAFEDTGAGNPASIWGSIDCQSDSRVQTLVGGDPAQTALGASQASDGFRRMTAYDGDDYWGERCELGHNDNRNGPTAVYHEGDHKFTFASIRLPSSLPLGTNQWQVVMQMKQAQPAANGSGTPMLSLRAYNGRWALLQSNSSGLSSDNHEIWSAPASSEQWTRFAFDVHYSQDPSQGSITVYVDLNGDGDAADAGEKSARMDTYTLKREISGGGDDGIDVGESIPSHLRAGIYHSPTIDCPTGCSVDIDNVQVVGAGLRALDAGRLSAG